MLINFWDNFSEQDKSIRGHLEKGSKLCISRQTGRVATPPLLVSCNIIRADLVDRCQ